MLQIDELILQGYNLPAELRIQLQNTFIGYSRPLPFTIEGTANNYEAARKAIDAERSHIALIKRYQELGERLFTNELNSEEKAELERVEHQLDDIEASFYEPALLKLNTYKPKG